jgi:selenocysteine lyase/cysteine desulfurase
MESCGAVVTFNVLDDAGRAVPFADVEARARAAHVSVRGGCFCNPGASEAAFGFDPERTAACIAETRRTGWNLGEFARRMRACGGAHAIGAVRASLGIASNECDVSRLIETIAAVSQGADPSTRCARSG